MTIKAFKTFPQKKRTKTTFREPNSNTREFICDIKFELLIVMYTSQLCTTNADLLNVCMFVAKIIKFWFSFLLESILVLHFAGAKNLNKTIYFWTIGGECFTAKLYVTIHC